MGLQCERLGFCPGVPDCYFHVRPLYPWFPTIVVTGPFRPGTPISPSLTPSLPCEGKSSSRVRPYSPLCGSSSYHVRFRGTTPDVSCPRTHGRLDPVPYSERVPVSRSFTVDLGTVGPTDVSETRKTSQVSLPHITSTARPTTPLWGASA